jgi:hypothetical protein
MLYKIHSSYIATSGEALGKGKGEVGDHPRPHLKIKSHPKIKVGSYMLFVHTRFNVSVILHTKVISRMLYKIHSSYITTSKVALGKGKGKVGDHPRPHLKIRPHSKFF